MSDSKPSNFTVDTYFIITIFAAVLWIILRKIWDTYMASRRHKKTMKSLSHINTIPNILDSIGQIMEQVQSIKNNTDTIMKSAGQSISRDMEEGVPMMPQ